MHEINISIIIPMYNEEDNVEHLLQEIQETLHSRVNYEIIVVDDGSTDNTYQKLKALQPKIPELVVIRHAKNVGQSVALVSAAKCARNEWLVTLDGDGQNNPKDILKLYAICQGKVHLNKPFVIFGNREKRNDTLVRRLSSRIANKIRSSLLKDSCPDTGCSLKMFPRDLFLQLPHFNHLHRYLPALFIRQGAEAYNIKVDHRPRLKGVSKYGIKNRLWVGIFDLIGVLWLQKRPCQVEVSRESN